VADRNTRFFDSRWGVVLVGTVIGVVASLLHEAGNPPNMGVCVACFERDIAGALGLHRAVGVQYLRPEIIGFVLGALFAALTFGEFKARAGSAPLVRFVLGALAMIGALVFLGCPWRALLRLAGGDLNAVVGLAGLIAGVAMGVAFLRVGYTPGRSYPTYPFVGWIMPVLAVGLLLLLIFRPEFSLGGPIFFSERGPGSQHAPVLISLSAACLIGFMAQRTRFCTVGLIPNLLLMGDTRLLGGVGALAVAAFVTNLLLGNVDFGFAAQPVAHSHQLWNFLGMSLAGMAFSLAGGCPGRQLVLAGEGNGDAAVFVLGMVSGAAFAHNFALAGRPDRLVEGAVQVGGPTTAGMVAVVIGLVVCLIIGVTMRGRE